MNKQLTNLKNAQHHRSFQRGAVLLEAMIAILLFSMGVLALVGLQAAMIKNTSASKFRADASYIAQQRIGQIWADPDNAIGYVETNTDISDLLPNGLRTVSRPDSVNFPDQYMITITWNEPGQPQHQFITTATIAGG
jgi:type IV pilus assembly protein PilV